MLYMIENETGSLDAEKKNIAFHVLEMAFLLYPTVSAALASENPVTEFSKEHFL